MANEALGRSRIGFIGCGAMARALAGGLIDAGVEPSQILAADPFPAARTQFDEAIGAKSVASNAEVVSQADVVVIAVKPGAVSSVLAGLDSGQSTRPLWISIAAGVPLSSCRARCPLARESSGPCQIPRLSSALVRPPISLLPRSPKRTSG